MWETRKVKQWSVSAKKENSSTWWIQETLNDLILSSIFNYLLQYFIYLFEIFLEK